MKPFHFKPRTKQSVSGDADRLAILEYKTLLELYKFEVDLFWKRSYLFLLFTAIAFLAYYHLQHFDIGLLSQAKSNFSKTTLRILQIFPRLFVCLAGIILSYWTIRIVTSGKARFESWEKKITDHEKTLNLSVFDMEGFASQYKTKVYSPSKILIGTASLTFFAWWFLI